MIDETELNKERSVIVEEIRSIYDSPEDLVHEVIDEIVWGDQGVGRPIAGTEETVGNDRPRRDGPLLEAKLHAVSTGDCGRR